MRKFKKSTLIKWTIAIAIIGILASILFPSYCDYLPRAKWAKAIASIAVLKLAVGECLEDNKGNSQLCNSIAKLNKYGIKAMPVLDKNAGKVELSAIANRYPLSILIRGSEELENCQFAFIPTIDAKESVIWDVFFINGADSDEEKCLSRVKGAKTLMLF